MASGEHRLLVGERATLTHRSARAGTAVVLVLAALVVPGLLTTGATASAPAAASPGAPAVTVPHAPAPMAPIVARPESSVSANCSALASGWGLLDAPDPAPPVASALQAPCVLGHDAPALYFVSNSSRSGSNVRFTVGLPPNGTSPASSMSGFWMGMWVGGIGCSYGGASYLTVELLPPYDTQAGVPGSPDWSVRAPVWDLVPAGSCDPQCQNDTAFFTVAGRSYCEDDAITSGFGTLTSTLSLYRPGDLLTVDVTGVAGSGHPLEVTVNDSTHPLEDTSWSYSGGAAGGGNVTPLFSASSTAATGWTGGLDVGFGWMNCPLPLAGDSFATSCNSYDGPVLNVSGAPEVDAVESWNATTHGFTNRYPTVVTASSSGACSGAAGAAPCADFTTYGGTGVYPTFGVSSIGGHAWYSYGPNSSEVRTTFGGGTTEFPANGSLSSYHDPTTLSVVSAVGSNDVAFAVRAVDPNGVSAVSVGSWWCTRNSTRISLSFPATLSVTPVNTSFDGNWTVNVPTGAAGMTGAFYYSVRARSVTGALTPVMVGKLTLTSGGGGGCGAAPPMAPGFALDDVGPLGGGYAVSWNESSASDVSNFTVAATPAAGGITVHFPEGNVTNARLTGLTGNISYHLQVVATNPAGQAQGSALVDAGPTYYPLIARTPNVTASSTWVNQTTVRINANATGGFPLFSFDIGFGDGSSTIVNTTSDEASAIHFYGRNYTGVARITVSVTDSVGDSATALPAYVLVQATPLAVPATMAGGNGFVVLHWSAPTAPLVNASAFDITQYMVYWTTNASAAPYLTGAYLSGGGSTTISLPTVFSQPDLPGSTLQPISVPDGTRVFAQVVAWDKYGEGLLPVESVVGEEPVLSAVAEPFGYSPISLTPGSGGPAPFSETFSTTFTTGAETSLVNATYRFSGGAYVTASIAGAGNLYWANASYTFDTPGLVNVYLYALDSVSELDLVTTSVLVTPGPAPIVTVGVAPTPVWVNASVGFSASASGGSGHYNYSWDLGDGSTASAGNTTYSYPTAGNYLVSVTVTDTVWGGVTVESVPVDVLSLPSVAIAATANGGPGTYRFTAIVVGGYGNFTYTWVFDDGTQGVGVTVSHTFATAGTYTVTLQAIDGYGHSVTATTIVVYGGTTTTAPAATGVSLGVAYLLFALVLVLAAIVVVLALRARRPPEATPAQEPGYGEEGGPGDQVPEADYAEEAPPGL
jgi:PKD repeat protein